MECVLKFHLSMGKIPDRLIYKGTTYIMRKRLALHSSAITSICGVLN
ncbi:hypothetical protein ACFOG5_01275 [Pedobacter fastidiosus]